MPAESLVRFYFVPDFGTRCAVLGNAVRSRRFHVSKVWGHIGAQHMSPARLPSPPQTTGRPGVAEGAGLGYWFGHLALG